MPIMMLLAVRLLMPVPCFAQSSQPDVALRSFLFYTGYSRLDPPNAGTSVDVIVPARSWSYAGAFACWSHHLVYARALMFSKENISSFFAQARKTLAWRVSAK